MKKTFIMFGLSIALLLGAISCDSPSSKPELPDLKTSLPSPMVELLPKGESSTLQFNIIGGTAPYKLSVAPASIAEATIDQKAVTLRALKVGDATLTITDAQQHKVVIKVKVKALVKLSLSATSTTIDLDNEPVASLDIQGYGDYQIETPDEANKVLLVTQDPQNKSKLLVKVLQSVKLTARVSITDKFTKDVVYLDVKVKPKSLKHLDPFPSLIDYEKVWIKMSFSDRKSKLEEYVKLTEEWLKKAQAVEDYKEKLPNHMFQKRNYEMGLTIFDNQKYIMPSFKEDTDPSIMWDCYTSIYQYGLGNAYLEFMARQCVLFRQKYPKVQKFNDLAGSFDNDAYNLDDGAFFTSLKKNYEAKYNELIDEYNKLERE